MADQMWPMELLKTNYKFLKTKLIFVISDPKNPRVMNFRRTKLIFKNIVRYFEFFQSDSGFLISDIDNSLLSSFIKIH